MRRPWWEMLPLLPVLIAGAVVPLVVRASFVPVSAETALLWTGERINVDFFSHQKAMLVLACGACCLASLLLRPAWRKDARTVYAALGLYAVCIVASTAFSAHARLALLGYPGRYEGGLVLLSYLLLCVAALNFVSTDRRARWVVGVVAASALLIGCIGVAQFTGHDLFGAPLGKWLVVPHGPFAEQGHPVIHNRPFTIATTLYNSNYVGSYMAMLAPLCFGRYLFADGRWMRWCWLGLAALLYLNLLGSQSRAGLLAGAVASAILLALLARQAPRRLWRLVPACGLLAAVVAGANVASRGLVAAEIANLWVDATALWRPAGDELALKSVAVEGGRIHFKTTQELLEITHAGGQLSFSDGAKPLRVITAADARSFRFNSGRFRDYTVTVDPRNLLEVRRTGLPVFRFQWVDGGFRLLNARGDVLSADLPQEWLASGRESLGSGRFYIWSKTMPLLRRCWLLGVGPDTFAAHFPQDDLVLKANVYDRIDVMVDKAHNGYLQVAVTTGFISLLALCVLFAGYVWSSLRLYGCKPAVGTDAAGLGLCLFCGFCGYALAFVFNDSVVSVAPVFWVLLGTGLAVNHLVAQAEATDGA